MNVGEDTKRLILGEEDASGEMSDAQRKQFIDTIQEQVTPDAEQVFGKPQPLETEQQTLTPQDRTDRLVIASLVWFLEKAGGYKKIPNQALDSILSSGDRRVVFERKEDHVKVSVVLPERSG